MIYTNLTKEQYAFLSLKPNDPFVGNPITSKDAEFVSKFIALFPEFLDSYNFSIRDRNPSGELSYFIQDYLRKRYGISYSEEEGRVYRYVEFRKL